MFDLDDLKKLLELAKNCYCTCHIKPHTVPHKVQCCEASGRNIYQLEDEIKNYVHPIEDES